MTDARDPNRAATIAAWQAGSVHSQGGNPGAEELRQPLIAFDPPWTSPYRVDPDHPHHLVNGEGERLFIVNKTAWSYFACRNPRGVLERAKEQGVNVIRVALEGAPYYEVLGQELWPWGGTRQQPAWAAWNEAYWEQVVERVRLAGEQGIGLDVVLYMALHPTVAEIDQQQPYWEETLRRLSTFANVLCWEIANEYTANEGFQEAAGRYLRRRDPHHRPVCTSAGTTDDAIWPDRPWVDLAINHTCTSSAAEHPLGAWYLALARNTRSHGKPAWCNESGREVRHRNDDGIHRRKQGWLWCVAGCFLTWHSWDGCEGIDDAGYHAPGWQYLRPLAEFFRALPFWRLDPTLTALAFGGELAWAALADADRTLAVGVACAERTGEVVQGATARLLLPEGDYMLRLLRPADLGEIAALAHASPGLRRAVEIPLPPFTDDLLLVAERVAAREWTAMPGTG